MIFEIKDTYDLIRLVEKITPPASYLLDNFFPNKEMTSQDYLPIETYKDGRRVAPFLSKGAKGLNVMREKSTVRAYKAPCIGARRVISLEDISMRTLGETPIFSTKTAEERAAEMQARDLKELLAMMQNRRSAMAAELLTTGKITVKEYGDDGLLAREEEIDYGGNVIEAAQEWSDSTANIYENIKAASERIQETTGEIPTLMVIGANVEKYLLKNKEILDWLMIQNRQNMTFGSFEPHYTSPQARYIGTINALNLEVYSYLETYKDIDGAIKPFVPQDMAIIGVAGRGRQVYGAVSYLDESKEWKTALAENVPIYNADTSAQQTSLTVLSRFLPVPEDLDDWIAIKVAE